MNEATETKVLQDIEAIKKSLQGIGVFVQDMTTFVNANKGLHDATLKYVSDLEKRLERLERLNKLEVIK